jgi:histone-lysine N-methyltransferase SETMAR
MTMPAHTLPPQRKIPSRHLVANNSIIPPYSPDLEPSDFHVFLHQKTFHDDKEVKEAVNTWFSTQAASFYDAGIQKLVPRHDRCFNSGGNYVEK